MTKDNSKVNQNSCSKPNTILNSSYFCPVCGQKNYIENRFCTKCGYPSPYDDMDIVNTNNQIIKYDNQENVFNNNYVDNTNETKIIIIITIVVAVISLIYLFNKPFSIKYVNVDNAYNDNPINFTFLSNNIVLSNPRKKGYEFEGWYADSQYNKQINSISTKQLNNVTIYAKWTELTYNIYYNLDGGSNNAHNPSYYKISDTCIVLYEPTKYDYDFAGWFDDNDNRVYEIDCSRLCDMALTAKWNAKEHTVSYHNTRGAYNPNETVLTSEDVYNLYQLDSINGYYFEGWYLDSAYTERVDTLYDIHKNINLYAKWELIEYTISLYDGSNSYDYKKYTINDNVKLPVLNKNGYKFLGWYDANDTRYSTIYGSYQGDMYLYSKWQANTYHITYTNTSSAVNTNPRTYTTDDYFYLEPLYREGYSFLGWYLDDSELSVLDGSLMRNITLKAKWVKN